MYQDVSQHHSHDTQWMGGSSQHSTIGGTNCISITMMMMMSEWCQGDYVGLTQQDGQRQRNKDNWTNSQALGRGVKWRQQWRTILSTSTMSVVITAPCSHCSYCSQSSQSFLYQLSAFSPPPGLSGWIPSTTASIKFSLTDTVLSRYASECVQKRHQFNTSLDGTSIRLVLFIFCLCDE